MKYKFAFLVVLLACLAFTACDVVDNTDNDTDDNQVVETIISLTEKEEYEPTPTPTPNQSESEKAKLEALIAENADGSLVDSFYADFNLDGVCELYASYRGDNVTNCYSDALWYTNGVDCSCVATDSGMLGYLFDTTNDGYSFVYTSDGTVDYGISVSAGYTVVNGDACVVDMSAFEGAAVDLRFSLGNFYYVTDASFYPIIWTGAYFADLPITELSVNDLIAIDTNELVHIQGNYTECFMRGDNILHINYETYDGVPSSLSYKVTNGVISEEILVFEDSVTAYGYYIADTVKREVLD